MKTSRGHYDEKFKRMAVERSLANSSRKTTAEELGITPQAPFDEGTLTGTFTKETTFLIVTGV